MEAKAGTMHSLVEFEHINELQQDLTRKMTESHKRDLGRIDSLRTAIPGMVLAENYERAKEELVAYVELKTAFPHFQQRVERLVQHCCELIQAIQTKRNFPGLAALSLAKQQEIQDKVIEHFEDLKVHIKQIENVERDTKLNDVRSTVWVVRAFCQGAVGICFAMFLMDVKNGEFGNLLLVTGSLVDGFTDWLVNLIH